MDKFIKDIQLLLRLQIMVTSLQNFLLNLRARAARKRSLIKSSGLSSAYGKNTAQ